MDFVEVRVQAPRELSDILVAELAEVGYNTFEDNDDGFCAYIDEDQFSADSVAEVMSRYEGQGEVTYEHRVITRQNWNAEWEKNFQPLVIADKVSVRAPFHEARPDPQYEIVIMPRMSFGTGHHATTAGCLDALSRLADEGAMFANVVDVGTGTGLLAFAARALWPDARVIATDNDPIAVEVAAGAAVTKGQKLLTLEAMNMEHSLVAPFDGVVAELNAEAGAQVSEGTLLARVEADSGAPVEAAA